MRKLKALVLAAAILAVPTAANAQLAFTPKTVNLRAGPARDYPVVAVLGSGTELAIQGCLQDYSWCDVLAGPYRGWVYAGNIVYPYQGASLPVIDYGAAVGIGVVAFTIGSYWHDHYVGRPWFSQMPQWRHRPPRLSVRPRQPLSGIRREATRHPAPAFRPPQQAPTASMRPRGAQAGARIEADRHRASTHQPPRANPGQRRSQTSAHPGREPRVRTGRVSGR